MAVTVIVFGATAMVSDHAWLVDQRDMLKRASDAAGIACTTVLSRLLNLDPNISDSDLNDTLEQVARRYILLNLAHLSPDRLATAEQTLSVGVTFDRHDVSVDVTSSADLGGTLLSKHFPLLGNYSGPGNVEALSAIETVINPVEVVLSLDVSESMKWSLADNRAPSRVMIGGAIVTPPDRMDIVKNAALELVRVLNPSDEHGIAIGVVPWANAVRLDANAIAEWEGKGWARYPTSRVYGVPYWCKPQGSCTEPGPVVQTVAAAPPQAWMGCLDGHRMGSVGTAASLPDGAELFTPPADNTFAQGYFSPTDGTSYECLDPQPSNYRRQSCYHNWKMKHWQTQFKLPSQFPCDPYQLPTLLPLSTDPVRIEQTIEALDHVGPRTYSALGVLWGQRLLDHAWNDVWGGGAHPVDPESRDSRNLRKAIVLLTDGEDTQCGQNEPACEKGNEIGISRTVACNAAKAEGTEIFVIAAMSASLVSTSLADTLRECSSEADNPDGRYVFLDNPTPDAIDSAFADIASQLRTVRRVY